MTLAATTPAPRSAGGLLYAVSAFVFWGLMVLYWRELAGVAPLRIMMNRALWSMVFVLLLIAGSSQLGALGAALRDPREMVRLLLSTSLLGVNWLIFIWAVQAGHALEASLGYYINPLLSILLGVVVLGERMSRPRRIAALMAAAGVVVLGVMQGTPPIIALSLAGTFALYGLIRKGTRSGPLIGLAVESLLMSLVAVPWFAWSSVTGTGGLFGDAGLYRVLLLVLGGAATALPLLWFAAAARRLDLSTLGFLQYIAPTVMFLIAVFAFGEPLTPAHFITFGLIWSAVALVGWESLGFGRR